MPRVSGRGLGLQASESTLTQLTSHRTDPKNKKQLLGLPRSTLKRNESKSVFSFKLPVLLKMCINQCFQIKK